MSNKKIFKELYSKKINKDYNYQEILKKIENKNKKINIIKHMLIPATSMFLVLLLIIININEKKSSLTEDIFSDEINNNNNQSFTNEGAEENNINTSSNQVINDINYEKISKYNFVKELNIPNDLNDKKYQEVYIKDEYSKDYNLKNHYQIYYQNTDDNRIINLTFSDNHKLINNYSDNEFKRKTLINNQEIIIYEDNQTYVTSFNCNDIYFYIETINITEKEFINLLKSIIKK